MRSAPRQSLLIFAYQPGPTYSELVAVRKERYASHGPALVEKVVRAMQLSEYSEDDDGIFLLFELNDLSRELAAMEPAWNPFSLKCFTACFELSPKRTIDALIDEVKVAFDGCLKSLTGKNLAEFSQTLSG